MRQYSVFAALPAKPTRKPAAFKAGVSPLLAPPVTLGAVVSSGGDRCFAWFNFFGERSSSLLNVFELSGELE